MARLVVETATRCCGRGVWSGNPSEPPECCGEPEVDVTAPTADDLVAWLSAHPDVAREVHAALGTPVTVDRVHAGCERTDVVVTGPEDLDGLAVGTPAVLVVLR